MTPCLCSKYFPERILMHDDDSSSSSCDDNWSTGNMMVDDDGECAKTIIDPTRVRFGTVTVRHYPLILGDHPACSNGVPLSIDWDYRQVFCGCLNDYEHQKKRESQYQYQCPFDEYHPRRPRTRSAVERFALVRDQYTADEIVQCALGVTRTKRERKESAKDNGHTVLSLASSLRRQVVRKLSIAAKTA